MRIALAQTNPTVGDVAGNTRLVLEAIKRARREKADLVLFSELALLGYPPRDLLLRDSVVEACEKAVETVAAASRGLVVVIGHPRTAKEGRKPAHNSAAVCRDGTVERHYDKHFFPGYDVFDEDRYFEPGPSHCVIEVDGRQVGILICEDLWRARDVAGSERLRPRVQRDLLAELAREKCEVLLVPSASPFVLGKGARHVEQLQSMARENRMTIALTNQVGANDDLIFDGRSIVVSATGDVLDEAAAFEEDLRVVDLESPRAISWKPAEPMSELWQALVLGVRDYVYKTAHESVIIGLSGGIDSAVTATIAAAALGPENVRGVMLPSRYSSEGSIEDAKALAANLGIAKLDEIGIEPAHAAMHEMLKRSRNGAASIAGASIGTGKDFLGVTDENIQSRIRCMTLMALSNATGSLVLSTGNKSEIAAGYTTLYGDMSGALSVLGDVLKKQVYDLARWINANHRACGFSTPPLPRSSIEKPPSAELRPNQTDQDTLPPYEILDEIIRRYIDLEQSVDQIIAETTIDPDLVRRMARTIDINEYKRVQSAIILKVNPRTFGPGRSMPVAMKVNLEPPMNTDGH